MKSASFIIVFLLCWHAAFLRAEETSIPSAHENASEAAEYHAPGEDDTSSEPETDEEDPGTNPDKELLTISDDNEYGIVPSSRAAAAAQRQSLQTARLLYEQAITSYETGNAKRAGELYDQSLQALGATGIDSATLYVARDEFDRLFAKMDKALESALNSDRPEGDRRYSIPMDRENELVRKYLKSYSSGSAKPVIKKALERSGRYRDMIRSILKEYDLPEELVYLPVVESLYNVNDLSRAGALGLWQIMPQRARALNLKVNYWIDERKDPEKSTRAAARYLKELYIMFGDWHLALAAYNRGEFGLGRDLQFSRATTISDFSSRNAVPRETARYVPQFIACTLLADNCTDYGLALNYEEPPAVDRVVINNVIDLKIAADCAGTTVETLRELNPAIKAWCTPQNYPNFELLLPAGTRERFLQQIALVKDLNPSRGFIKYKVVKGDHLGKIAKKFGTTAAAIKSDNKLKSSKILRIGQVLVIKPGRKYKGSGT